jgi:excisionase family DNA binding protein
MSKNPQITLPDWLPRRLLTVGEVSEFLNLSERQVRRMIADGRLTAVAFGRAKRVRPEAIAELL